MSDCTNTHRLRDSTNPIDLVESLADKQNWHFCRQQEDQISMEIKGQWRNYTILLSLSHCGQMLRILCAYAIQPPHEKVPALLAAVNEVNSTCWSGAFVVNTAEELMLWQYSLPMHGCASVNEAQVEFMIAEAISSCEQHYPCFALVVWGDKTPADAMQIAMAKTYGRA